MTKKGYIDKQTSQTVVTIGIEYKNYRGGISKLIHTYSSRFEVFNFIKCTSNNGLKINKLWIFLISLIKLIYVCFNNQIKIVHIHTSTFSLIQRDYIYILVSHFLGKKVILHMHGGMLEKICETHNKKLKFLFRKVDVIICVSKYIANIIKKYQLTDKRCEILYNPIDKPNFELMCNSKENSRINILFMGSIDKNKGIFDVIEAMALDPVYYKSNINFFICGRGLEKDLSVFAYNEGLEECVFIEGWADKEKKEKFLCNSDIYIQPSYFESLGIAILEAMSYGLPVISTRAGGIPEIVKNDINGILVNPGDKEAIDKAIKKLVENEKLRKQMGNEGKKIALNFSSEIIIDRLNNIYQQLI